MAFSPVQGCPKCQALAEGMPMMTGAVKYTCRQCGNTWMETGTLK
ncbi:Uncharacterised protein [uncultured archaeon]|nr:Uncharacterised protein [uncultured archaeon]